MSLTFKNGIFFDKSLIDIRETIGLVNLPSDVKTPVVKQETASNRIPFIIISLESSSMNFADPHPLR